MGVGRRAYGTIGRTGFVVVVIMLLALAVGCGSLVPSLQRPTVGGSAGEGRRPASDPSPSTSASTPPPMLPGVHVSNLPIGGRSRYADSTQSLQCVVVHWATGPTSPAGLRGGISVRITTAAYDRSVFRLSNHGCGSSGPSCLGHTFSASGAAATCSLALRTRWPLSTTLDDRRVSLGGLLSCPETLGSVGCQRSATAIVEHWKSISVSTPHRRVPERG